MNNGDFYSNGKLLITGEYFVLKGAKCLAIPLKKGQKMNIEPVYDNQHVLYWNSFYNNQRWFHAVFSLNNIEIIESSNYEKASYIQNLLKELIPFAKYNILKNNSLKITTVLEFNPEWGFGSSSTLISNLAYWANVDPYWLLNKTSNGSGYDIACARANGPIIYSLSQSKPDILPVHFKPAFSDKIYFVYMGNKVSSTESISQNMDKIELHYDKINRVNEITTHLTDTLTIEEFQQLLDEHENIVSAAIQQKPVQKQLFPDFNGTIKSLGAWGGDFIMAVSSDEKENVYNYFKDKGLNVIFNYNDLIL